MLTPTIVNVTETPASAFVAILARYAKSVHAFPKLISRSILRAS
jgi:hypothetical protein